MPKLAIISESSPAYKKALHDLQSAGWIYMMLKINLRQIEHANGCLSVKNIEYALAKTQISCRKYIKNVITLSGYNQRGPAFNPSYN